MSTSRRLVPPIDDPAFTEIRALIIEATGHHYYDDKDSQLAERIGKRMAALGVGDATLYLERLRDSVTGPREWRLLESELTIKETFFFRFAEQFAALRTHILPAMIARHADDRHLRIWSAGCSTGAEPYSLAVLIHDLLGERMNQWHVSILGTDLDETALADARAASYGGWALRTVAPEERERLFQLEGTKWRLKTVYRGMVRFERHNLLDLLGPVPAIGRNDYDLILCRNLLIYFHPDRAAAVVSALGERLAAQGKLLLGHAESGIAAATRLVPVELGGIVVYMRDDLPVSTDEPPEPPVPAPRPRPPLPPRRGPRRMPRRDPGPPLSPRPSEPPPSTILDEVRALLGRGETAQARQVIEQAKPARRDDPVLLYLDGLGALAEQDGARAERALRGAIYLDRGFAMAQYLLAQQLFRDGKSREGRRMLANAAEALSGADADALVPEGEGLTAGDLREAIRHRLDDAGQATR